MPVLEDGLTPVWPQAGLAKLIPEFYRILDKISIWMGLLFQMKQNKYSENPIDLKDFFYQIEKIPLFYDLCD